MHTGRTPHRTTLARRAARARGREAALLKATEAAGRQRDAIALIAKRSKKRAEAMLAAMAAAPAAPLAKGRAEHDPAADAEMREIAAAAITLARSFGRRGFSEASLFVYPRRDSDDSQAKVHAADGDALRAMRDSPLPAALLILSTFYVCAPVARDARLYDFGTSFVEFVRRRERLRAKERKEPEPSPLMLEAMRAILQAHVAKGAVPFIGRKKEAVPAVLKRFRLSARMRAYWRSHPKWSEAFTLVTSLVEGSMKGKQSRGSGQAVFAFPALTRLLTGPKAQGIEGTAAEKKAAVEWASARFDDYRNMLGPRAIHVRRGNSEDQSEDFRDEIAD